METMKLEQGVHTINDALMHLEFLKQQLAGMGNNDTEFPSFEGIEDKLVKGEIAPQDAIEAAEALIADKLER